MKVLYMQSLKKKMLSVSFTQITKLFFGQKEAVSRDVFVFIIFKTTFFFANYSGVWLTSAGFMRNMPTV